MLRRGYTLKSSGTIATRYLKYQRRLAREALARLADDDDPDPEMTRTQQTDAEAALERPLRLQQLRIATVAQALLESGARRVLDLGCGEGHLLRELLRHRQFDQIVGLDASVRALEIAQARLKLDQLAPQQRQRLQLLHGALTYRDARLSGYDAAAVVEVIEHLDLARLAAFERVLFACARPRTVVVTTPNREYNVKFPFLPAGYATKTTALSGPGRSFRSGQVGSWRDMGITGASRRSARMMPCLARLPRGGVHMQLTIPDFCLVILIGPSGAGKTHFARTHFKPTEVIASDTCRALVCDDETDQAATADAFDLLQFIATKWLAARRLTVIDATNVRREDRKSLLELARAYHALAVAIVVNLPEQLCQERNRQRPERSFGRHVIRLQTQQLRYSLRGLQREGFRYVYVLDAPAAVEAATIVQQRLWTDRC